jgi:hypothetical protein
MGIGHTPRNNHPPYRMSTKRSSDWLPELKSFALPLLTGIFFFLIFCVKRTFAVFSSLSTSMGLFIGNIDISVWELRHNPSHFADDRWLAIRSCRTEASHYNRARYSGGIDDFIFHRSRQRQPDCGTSCSGTIDGDRKWNVISSSDRGSSGSSQARSGNACQRGTDGRAHS